MKPELSKRSVYWLDKHRYYELKHFCMQYPLWKDILVSMDGFSKNQYVEKIITNTGYGRPTEDAAIARLYYADRIDMINKTADLVDPVIGKYLLRGVALGVSYDILKTGMDIPCGREYYYDIYRRFFYELDKVRK